ncbi:MAG: ABC transporter permease, partial [Betaproteobacteria bacterium]|nr:ABC transporter permease [Betaproteobacteria bacterium]
MFLQSVVPPLPSPLASCSINHYFQPTSEKTLHPLSLFIGLRYTLAKRSNRFISFISLVSMLGIAVGITALITVMSVMNGFQKEVRASLLGVASHIQINGFEKGLA